MTSFKQIDEILTGRKTQTRRLWNVRWRWDMMTTGFARVLNVNGHELYAVGKAYAVQPGRGKSCLRARVNYEGQWIPLHEPDTTTDGWYYVRYIITALWAESLQSISEDDAKAEGVLPANNGKLPPYIQSYRNLWNSINTREGTRWQDNPSVLVITFEVVLK